MTRTESLPISLTRRADAVGDAAGLTVVWVSGDHDASSALSLASVIERSSDLDNAGVVVDLSEVTFMDASVVGTLVRARNRLHARGLSLQVRSPSAIALRLLELCGVTDLLLAGWGVAPALATWVDVPIQPTPAGQPVHTEARLAVEVDRASG
jgi:anti-sigma B factor antagonist